MLYSNHIPLVLGRNSSLNTWSDFMEFAYEIKQLI